MQIAVTGATGFIGQSVVANALREGWCVRAASRQVHANKKDLAWFRTHDQSVEEYASIFDGCDAVIHLAGPAHARKSDRDTYRNGIIGLTKTILRACERSQVPRLIFASTVKVFGSHQTGRLSESTVPEPDCDYGRAKLQAEQMLLTATGATRGVILRLPPVYGSGMKGGLKHIFALSRLPIPVVVPCSIREQNFVWVENLAKIFLAAAEGQVIQQVLMAHDPKSITIPALMKAVRESSNLSKSTFMSFEPPSVLKDLMMRHSFGQAMLASKLYQTNHQDVLGALGLSDPEDAIRAIVQGLGSI
jgi:UDP-glucose 4-epimerase